MFLLLVVTLFQRTVQGCWLPTPFASFPVTSRFVRRHVPSGSERAIIPNNTLDALLITQLSNNGTVLLEIHNGNKIIYAASIYLDFNDSIENNLKTLEKILEFTKGAKLITAMDSNSRSTTWHDMITNSRGKLLEEFIASNQLYIINEDSPRMTFESSRGSSNIDLTIINNQMLADIKDWELSEEESGSDHSILKFNINFANNKTKINNFPGLWYIIKEQHTEFYKNFFYLISKNFQIEDNEGNAKETDEELNARLIGQKDIRGFIKKLDETIQTTCKKTCINT